MKSSKRLKHLLTMVLSMLMLFSAILVSCADNGQKQPSDDSTSTSSSDTVSDDNDRLNISDNLPKTDMDGYELRFLVREGIDESLTLNDEKAEDVIDEAVYNRQLYIQERFNCKLSKVLLQEGAADSELNGKVISNVSVDDNEFQIVIGSTGSTPLATEGYLATWETAPNVDFDKPWWNKTANDSLTINGNSFFAFGDINYWLIFQTNCLYFNKQLIEDYQMEDPYQVVLDGRWTLDYLSNISKQYYKDLNNDNARDIDDFYVYTVDVASGLSSYQNSTQNLMYKKDSDDIPVFSAATQRMGNLIEKMYDILYKNEGTYAIYDYSIQANEKTLYWWDVSSYKYKSGTTIFAHGWLWQAADNDLYRSTEFEYGIIPLPKYDEKQKTYNSMMDASGPLMCMPRSVREDEITNISTLIEAMAAYGYKHITPAVFDVALKVKYSTLEGSGKMLDLLIEGVIMDFGYIYSSDYHNIIHKVLYQKNSNLGSWLAKNQKSLESYYDDIIESYLNYGLE